MIPLRVPEIRRILAALTTRALPPPHIIHWDAWTRRHPGTSTAGTTSAHACNGIMPWSASKVRLPYQGAP